MMTDEKIQKIKSFDANGIGDVNNNIYGLPFDEDEADVILIPVPWEVTVSYNGGTVDGPEAIYEASYQVDLYDPKIPNAWTMGLFMEPVSQDLKLRSKGLRHLAEKYIEKLSEGPIDEAMLVVQDQINTACAEMNKWVYDRCINQLNKHKVVGLIGGDHSTPLGMVKALAEKHDSFGILQIDAHCDLRNAYEGFEYSHASIMTNVLKIKNVNKLVQVGVRDYCEEELNAITDSKGRVKTFFDRDIKYRLYHGTTWSNVVESIVRELPDKIYLSFDIDGLDPKLCPNTGTPVAGGFEAEQILYLIEKVIEKGIKIIAFDINEVAPGTDGKDWDANVAARLLYRIANLVAWSQGKRPLMQDVK
jgi:agmatinase